MCFPGPPVRAFPALRKEVLTPAGWKSQPGFCCALSVSPLHCAGFQGLRRAAAALLPAERSDSAHLGHAGRAARSWRPGRPAGAGPAVGIRGTGTNPASQNSPDVPELPVLGLAPSSGVSDPLLPRVWQPSVRLESLITVRE